MTKSAFEKIAAGLADVKAIRAGTAEPGSFRVHVPEKVDVRSIRKGLGLTQEKFATGFGFSVGAVRDWEQDRSNPDPATRVLLRVIEREPEAVRRALELT
ncbi:MAG: transcriptional regulator, family [Caulobacteraceae bacterium]|nr:transcriptional regulator, family [Caulobacteraceae bacterium]